MRERHSLSLSFPPFDYASFWFSPPSFSGPAAANTAVFVSACVCVCVYVNSIRKWSVVCLYVECLLQVWACM
jgi:hypothetical protein